MIKSGLDLKWWPEILLSIVKIRNCSPHTAFKNMTPYEAWYGDKPDINIFRTLGCDCLSLKPIRKRKDLVDVKALPCKLLGFEGTLIYRVCR